MKVLLTNSPLPESFRIASNLRGSGTNLYLGSMLLGQKKLGLKKIDGIEVIIEDYNLKGKDGLRWVIEKEDPDVIGLSVYELNFREVRKLVKEVKEIKKDVLVFGGGAMPTWIPKNTLRLTGLDGVFRGYADFTFYQVISKLSKGVGLGDLDVCGFSQMVDDKIIYGNNSDKIATISRADYEAIEINYDLFLDMVIRNEYKAVDFAFSRGCPNKCSFCQISPVNNGYMALSLDKSVGILDQLTSLIDLDLFVFGDGIFGGGKERAKKFMGEIIRKKINERTKFYGELTVDMVLDGLGDFKIPDIEMINLLYHSNFKGIEFGIEQFGEGVKKFNKNNYDVAIVQNLMAIMSSIGINSNFSMLFVGPDTSSNELAESLKNAIFLNYTFKDNDFLEIGGSDVLTAYVGTKEYQKIINYMREDPIYGYLSKQLLENRQMTLNMVGLEYCFELPEDDGFPYLFERFIPFDAEVAGTLYDLEMYGTIKKVFGKVNENYLTRLMTFAEILKRNVSRENYHLKVLYGFFDEYSDLKELSEEVKRDVDIYFMSKS